MNMIALTVTALSGLTELNKALTPAVMNNSGIKSLFIHCKCLLMQIVAVFFMTYCCSPPARVIELFIKWAAWSRNGDQKGKRSAGWHLPPLACEQLEVLFIYPPTRFILPHIHHSSGKTSEQSTTLNGMKTSQTKMQINMHHQGEDLIEAYDWPTFNRNSHRVKTYPRGSARFSSLTATIQIPRFPNHTVAVETPAAARQSF